MITKNIVSFLNELKENNNREWFNANKKKYETAKKDFEDFVISFIPEVIKIDKNLGMLQPKDCIFRIYRDTRFSNDKTPYKTNFGVFFVKGGKSSWRNAGYYLHIEPNGYFIGGGIHMPPSDILKIVRKEIFYNIEEFKAILNDKKFKATFEAIDADKLKSAPRDFPKDFPDIDLLKFTSYTVGKQITETELLAKNFPKKLKETFIILSPFVKFINGALEEGLN